MIKIKIEYRCGCGFKTEDKEKAIEHCVLKSHTLYVVGEIQKEDKKWKGDI